MLYVTTRNNKDAHTAFSTLNRNCSDDGGLFVPFRLPRFSAEQIMQLKEVSFAQIVAHVLNLYFPAHLKEEDVLSCVGKETIALRSMSHKVIVAQLWHSPKIPFRNFVQRLGDRLQQNGEGDMPTDWAFICIRIAFLFGIYGEMLRKGIADGIHPTDFAVASDDFSAPISAWYAREMGLPVGTIICACDNNDAVWDLFHHGQLRCVTDSSSTSATPVDLERLVYGVLGLNETLKYIDILNRNAIYAPLAEDLQELKQGFYAAVVSAERVQSTVLSVYRTTQYLLSARTSLAYAGMQDYRAQSGASKHVVILSEEGFHSKQNAPRVSSEN